MKAAVVLLLSLVYVSPTCAQTETEDLSRQEDFLLGAEVADLPHLPVVWDELRGLKELVLNLRGWAVDQRLVLRNMETRVRDQEMGVQEQRDRIQSLETALGERQEQLRTVAAPLDSYQSRLADMQKENSALAAAQSAFDIRLRANEKKVEDLNKKNAALAAEVPFLEMRLRASEITIETLRRRNAVLAARMCDSERLMEELGKLNSAFPQANTSSHSAELSDLEARMRTCERQVGDLRRESSVLNSSAISALQSRLNLTDQRLDQLSTQATEQTVRLRAVEDRMNLSQSLLEELRRHNKGQAEGLSDLLSRLTTTETEHAVLQSRLNATDIHLGQLSTENTGLVGKVNSNERHLEEINRGSIIRAADLVALTDRLTVGESERTALNSRLSTGEANVEALKTGHAAQATQLADLSSRVTAAETWNAALEARLSVSDSQWEALKRDTTAQLDELLALAEGATANRNQTEGLHSRLTASEMQLEELKMENTAHKALLSALGGRMRASETKTAGLESSIKDRDTQMTAFQRHNSVLERRLNVTEELMEQLTAANSDSPNVAFSAGLTDSGAVGPFDDETTLVFSKTFTNIGQAYNQKTGVFTAPVRGVYYFRFTAADYLKGYMGLYLYKNSQKILFNLDLNDHGGYTSSSNGLTLVLEAGDTVYLSLPASYRVYDDSRNFSIFSGFLLFPLKS